MWSLSTAALQKFTDLPLNKAMLSRQKGFFVPADLIT